MPTVRDFIEAGDEYGKQIAASNPIISNKPIKQWFQEIADKMEHDQAIEEMTLEYNLSLLEGEDPMTEEEMAEIMELNRVAERSCWECEYCIGSYIDAEGNEIPSMIICPNSTLNDDPGFANDCEYFKPRTEATEVQKGSSWQASMSRNCWDCRDCVGKDPDNELLVLCNHKFDSVDSDCAKWCRGFRAKAKSEQERKCTDYDTMVKKIALLKQEIEHLKAALRELVSDRDMSKQHRVNWKLLAGDVQVIQKPGGKLEPCEGPRKVKRDG